jgi:hypothetical protein
VRKEMKQIRRKQATEKVKQNDDGNKIKEKQRMKAK